MTDPGRGLMLAGALAVCGLAPGLAAPRLAVDIAPVQSIAARVMAGVGTPELIVPPGVSEHDYALRPSEAGLLQDADLVVWIGPDLTPWLAGPIEALASDARVVTLAAVPGTVLLPIRDDGPFEAHAHAVDAQGGPDDHARDDHARTEDAHAHDDGHGHDGHLWLDPVNGAAFAAAIAAALAEIDPANAATYAANAAAFGAETTALEAEIAARLAPVRGRPFLVFHDAYQYFEARFDISASGSVALGEAAPPGAARVAEIRGRVRDEEIVCAFAEPQFEPKLLATVIEGTEVRTGTLDPIGATLPPGPELYPALLRGLAASLADCLADGR